MGCYESFSADIKCIKCGNEFFDDNIQSKDFACVLDHLEKGEDTRQLKRSGFLYKDDMFDKKLTIDKALEIVQKNPKDYTMTISYFDDKPSVRVDHYYGQRQTTFFGIKEREFNCYTSCPKCKTFNDYVGVIKNFRFIGVKPLLIKEKIKVGM